MYPMGIPQNAIREPIFAPRNFRRLDENHGWVTGAPLGPLATALNFAGAVRVRAKDFRTSEGTFGLESPLVNGD